MKPTMKVERILKEDVDMPYECQTCYAMFMEPADFEAHRSRCGALIVLSSEDEFDDEVELCFSDDKSLILEELNKVIGGVGIEDANSEVDEKDGKGNGCCTICNNGRVMTREQLVRHYKRHRNLLTNLSADTKRQYYCHECRDDVGMSRGDLLQHHQAMHSHKIANKKQFFKKAMSKRPRSPRPEVYRCEICSAELSDQRLLDEHVDNHEDQYLCEVCSVGFKKVIDYTLHLQQHDENKLYKCLLCPFETSRRHLVKSHLYSVHERFKKYKCNICQKGFAIFTHFQEHKYYHSGEKPFVCDICGQRFMYTRYLNSHKVQMHKNVTRSVECKICHKTYSHRNSLHTHMRSHTGSVSVCDVCGKTLSSNEKLRLHYRIHTGEKPYKCEHCDKTFKTRSYCVEHERTHTGEKPYVCPFCSKCFSQRTSMMIHTRGHTGEKPYVCHLCNKGFAARSMVNVHLKSCRGGLPKRYKHHDIIA